MTSASYGYSKIPLSEVAALVDPPMYRDPGFHVSELIAKVEEMSSSKRRYDDDEEESGLMSMGKIWEAVMRHWMAQYCSNMGLHFQPSVKVQMDEIFGNLDGVVELVVDGMIMQVMAVVESKFTTTKDARPESKWKWLSQGKAYCHMLGEDNPLCVWYPVLQIPKSGPPDAVFHLFTHTFKEHETAENWQMLLNMKQYLEGR